MENRRRLFVYGTLKQGQSNHGLLGGAAKIADGYTVKKMVTMNTGKFPVVFTGKRGRSAMLSVAGEIYEIEHHLILELDRLDDLGGMYDRGNLPNKNSRWRGLTFDHVCRSATLLDKRSDARARQSLRRALHLGVIKGILVMRALQRVVATQSIRHGLIWTF